MILPSIDSAGRPTTSSRYSIPLGPSGVEIVLESLLHLADSQASATALGEGLAPVLGIALALAGLAIATGATLAHWITGGGRDDLQRSCRLHDWIRLDSVFICAQCGYQARSHGLAARESLPPI